MIGRDVWLMMLQDMRNQHEVVQAVGKAEGASQRLMQEIGCLKEQLEQLEDVIKEEDYE